MLASCQAANEPMSQCRFCFNLNLTSGYLFIGRLVELSLNLDMYYDAHILGYIFPIYHPSGSTLLPLLTELALLSFLSLCHESYSYIE